MQLVCYEGVYCFPDSQSHVLGSIPGNALYIVLDSSLVACFSFGSITWYTFVYIDRVSLITWHTCINHVFDNLILPTCVDRVSFNPHIAFKFIAHYTRVLLELEVVHCRCRWRHLLAVLEPICVQFAYSTSKNIAAWTTVHTWLTRGQQEQRQGRADIC